MAYSDDIDRIKEVYNSTYPPDPKNRGYLWHPSNPVSVYFRQSREKVLIELINKYNFNLDTIHVLDIGCGTGNFLRFMASLGTPPENLHGLDLIPHRIEYASKFSPAGTDLQVGNAMTMGFPDGFFDVVTQFTVFSSIFDQEKCAQIAEEMVRVLKPSGYILWYDLREGNSPTVKGIGDDEVKLLFQQCEIIEMRFLHPPYATRLAKRSIFLCDILDRFPGLKKTHCLALIKKI